ncbi:hypothetical protein GQ602_006285 [Ophiocordyceps camponoti-floridani]|uniref:Uncharacterized protein n=1 Tax=Ophiocordyceps camponoti-floridani TaxID=2030778 RepID=A0A8H4Q2V8_9HYPO|nr:hypothetical protein GQ602_006285 [Ophiocordyceps camponoti-floridani]
MQRVIIDILHRQQKTVKQCFTAFDVQHSHAVDFLARYVATHRIGRVMDFISERDVVDGRFFLSARGFDFIASEVDGFAGSIDLARMELPVMVDGWEPGPFEDNVRRKEAEIREAAEREPANPEPDVLELFKTALGPDLDPEVRESEVKGSVREKKAEEEAEEEAEEDAEGGSDDDSEDGSAGGDAGTQERPISVSDDGYNGSGEDEGEDEGSDEDSVSDNGSGSGKRVGSRPGSGGKTKPGNGSGGKTKPGNGSGGKTKPGNGSGSGTSSSSDAGSAGRRGSSSDPCSSTSDTDTTSSDSTSPPNNFRVVVKAIKPTITQVRRSLWPPTSTNMAEGYNGSRGAYGTELKPVLPNGRLNVNLRLSNLGLNLRLRLGNLNLGNLNLSNLNLSNLNLSNPNPSNKTTPMTPTRPPQARRSRSAHPAARPQPQQQWPAGARQRMDSLRAEYVIAEQGVGRLGVADFAALASYADWADFADLADEAFYADEVVAEEGA